MPSCSSYWWCISPGSSSFHSFLVWHSHLTLYFSRYRKKYLSFLGEWNSLVSREYKDFSFLIDAVKKQRTSLNNVLSANPLDQIPTLKKIYSTAQFENEQESTWHLTGCLKKWQSAIFQRKVLYRLQVECTRWMNVCMWQGPYTV